MWLDGLIGHIPLPALLVSHLNQELATKEKRPSFSPLSIQEDEEGIEAAFASLRYVRGYCNKLMGKAQQVSSAFSMCSTTNIVLYEEKSSTTIVPGNL